MTNAADTTSREFLTPTRRIGEEESVLESAATAGGSLGRFLTLADGIREHRAVSRSLAPGEHVDRYEVVSLIGRGGFSDVYKVRHRYLDHEYALKTLREDQPSDTAAERYLREARTLALLDHPFSLRVFDASLSRDGIPYIITELLLGETLREKTKRGQTLSAERALDLLEEVGAVLVRQEKLGILHRDIKPSNIFERPNGSFCIFDYATVGLVGGERWDADLSLSLTDTLHGILGTPIYMAPEQFDGVATHQSDLFGLGMTAWECLAGEPPRDPGLGFTDLQECASTALSITDVLPLLPPPVACMLDSLLAPDPSDRYGAASELIQDLHAHRYRGEPPVGPVKGNCFVAIPYTRRFGSVYDAIRTAASKSKLRARRMDEIAFTSDVWRMIETEIETAVIVVADFTKMGWRHAPNPNVITEAAHARAVGKPLIILSQDSPERLPFDWRHMPIIRYRRTAEGLAALERLLTGRLDYFMTLAAQQGAGEGRT